MVVLPKKINVRFENNGDGTSFMEYKEVLIYPDSKTAQFSKEATAQVFESITKQKNPQIKKCTYRLQRIKNQIFASMIIVGNTDTVVNAVITEFEAQILSKNTMEKWLEKEISNVVGKKEVKRLIVEKKKLLKKHNIDLKKLKVK